ncbi:MAG: hypothetical protein MUP68_17880 [Deltaproteobacteria bacterium]|nr:hypothetical protein [Deltaproteobacteria bacterium]
MRTDNLKKALQPYEAKLQAQERFRKLIGVKEVDGPTYEKYIVGPIERFERKQNHQAKKISKIFRERLVKVFRRY